MPLINIIQSLINESQTSGRPSKRKLPNGLHLSLMNKATTHTLILSRDKVYPSQKEWETVLNHWPYHVEQIEPSQIIDNDRRMALKADIPQAHATQRQLL